MIYANDYARLTKDYLQNISYYRVAIVNMTDGIREMEESLRDVSPKIASYEQTAGGASVLNIVEAESERRLLKIAECKEQLHELHKLKRQVEKIERGIASLPEEEKQAVTLFYIRKLTYKDMAEHLKWSERTCRRRVSAGTKNIALMLFGERAKRQILFVS